MLAASVVFVINTSFISQLNKFLLSINKCVAMEECEKLWNRNVHNWIDRKVSTWQVNIYNTKKIYSLQVFGTSNGLTNVEWYFYYYTVLH